MEKIIYLAYANSEENRLPNLLREADITQKKLENLSYKIIPRPYATTDILIRDIGDGKEKFCVFHYSGHSSPDRLLLENKPGDSRGLAGLLKECPNLRLIFLNGCSTEEQIQYLLDHPKPRVVIATTTSIPDDVAADFAIQFYKSLSFKGTSLQKAFSFAKSAIQFDKSREKGDRGIGIKADKDHSTFHWIMKANDDSALEWGFEYLSTTQRKQMDLKEFLQRLASAYEPEIAKLLNMHAGETGKKSEQIEDIITQWKNVSDLTISIQKGRNRVIRQFIDNFTNILPFPVGCQLFTFLTIEGEGFPEFPKVDHLRLAVQVYDACMELVAFTMLSQLWEAIQYLGVSPPDSPELDVLKKFFLQTNETLKAFNLVELTRNARMVFERIAQEELEDRKTGKLYVGKLEELKAEIGREKDLGKIISYLQKLNDAKSRLLKEKFVTELPQLKDEIEDEASELNRIVTFFQMLKIGIARNEINQAQCSGLFPDAVDHLCSFLERINFILRYSLVNIRSIVLQKYRHRETMGYNHEMIPLPTNSGGYDDFTYQDVAFSKSIVLVKDFNKMGDNLPLSPFIIDKNVFVTKKPSLVSLHVYNGYDAKKDTYCFRRVEKPDELLFLDPGNNDFKVVREQLEEFSQKVFGKPLKEIWNENER